MNHLTYVCMYVCMYVHTYIRMFVDTYVCMYVCMYIRTYVRTYICIMYVRMHVCMYVKPYASVINSQCKLSCHVIITTTNIAKNQYTGKCQIDEQYSYSLYCTKLIIILLYHYFCISYYNYYMHFVEVNNNSTNLINI